MCRSIIYIPSGYKLCDFVANQYFIGSFKKGTAKKRADDSPTMQLTGDNQFPTSFGDFFSNSVNKNNLSRS